MSSPLVTIENLRTWFDTDEGVVRAVDDVSLVIPRGKTLGLVGESGCGKSVTAMSIIQLISSPGRIVGGRIVLHGGARMARDGAHAGSASSGADVVLSELAEPQMRAIRGGRISMIFQEPMTARQLAAQYAVLAGMGRLQGTLSIVPVTAPPAHE